MMLSALRILALPILAAAFFSLYGAIMLYFVNNVSPLMPVPFRKAILFVQVVCGIAASAAVFTYPLSRLYRNYAALAGFLMCMPVIFVRAESFLQSSGQSFTVIFYVFELILLSSAIPVVAWRLHNRFHAGLTLHKNN